MNVFYIGSTQSKKYALLQVNMEKEDYKTDSSHKDLKVIEFNHVYTSDMWKRAKTKHRTWWEQNVKSQFPDIDCDVHWQNIVEPDDKYINFFMK